MAQNNVIELILKLRDQISEPLDGVRAKLGGLGGTIAGIAGIATAGAILNKVISSTIEAEDAVFKLDQAYKVFGKTVGVTRENILQFSNDTQRATIFGDEELTRAQTLLLRFASVTGKTFERARIAAVDFAAATGQSVESASQIIGRAIERPEIALRQLRASGVIFSKSQEDVIRKLAETGQRAKASEILLSELENRFKGTAEAARGTLGGALRALGNAFGDLFEAEEGGRALADAVNGLTEAIANPALRTAIQGVGSEMLKWLTAALGLINLTISGWQQLTELFTRAVTRVAVGETDPIKRLQKELDNARSTRDGAGRFLPKSQREDIDANITRLEALITTMKRVRDERAKLAKNVGAPSIAFAPEDGGGALGIVTGAMDDGLEVVVTSTKRSVSAIEQFYQDLEQSTRTSIDVQIADYARLEAQIQELVSAGRISREQGADRASEGLDKILNTVQITAKKVEVPLSAAQERFQEFADSVGSGIGNAISQGGLNGLTSLRDIVKQSLRNIIADIVTSGISRALKSQFSGIGGGGGDGGFFGSLIKGFTSIFGFGKAGGGQSSGWTLVGEGGPELVRAPLGGSMKVYNRSQLSSMMPSGGGPISISSNPQVIVQGDISEKNQAMVLGAMEQTHSRSMREMVRLLERNGLRRPV
jgi:hypothetical protein